MQRLQVLGNVGRVDVTDYTNQFGKKLLEITVADSVKGYTKQDGTQVPERTEWFRFTQWLPADSKMIEIYQRAKKVLVEGRKVTEQYKDKNTGEDKKSERWFADKIDVCEYKQDQPAPQPQPQAYAPQPQYQGYAPYPQGQLNMPPSDGRPF